VLATAGVANDGAEDLAQKCTLVTMAHHFFSEAHPKLRPVEDEYGRDISRGACQAPKDIPDSVGQASAAAEQSAGTILPPVN